MRRRAREGPKRTKIRRKREIRTIGREKFEEEKIAGERERDREKRKT